jgi:hypothetical protein
MSRNIKFVLTNVASVVSSLHFLGYCEQLQYQVRRDLVEGIVCSHRHKLVAVSVRCGTSYAYRRLLKNLKTSSKIRQMQE